MANYISMKQVPGGTVAAVDDRILYDYAINSGIIYGCEISYTGNNMIHINAGYGIIKGGLFEMEDHTEYVPYSESGNTTGQIYLHFDAAATDKLTIVKQTSSSLHPMTKDENANYDNGVYEIQLCTYTATTTALTNVKQTFVKSTIPIDVLNSLEDIMANTDTDKAAGALAVKQLNSNLVANGKQFHFAYEDGKYGYKVGADAFCPFNQDYDEIICMISEYGYSSKYFVYTPSTDSYKVGHWSASNYSTQFITIKSGNYNEDIVCIQKCSIKIIEAKIYPYNTSTTGYTRNLNMNVGDSFNLQLSGASSGTTTYSRIMLIRKE